MAAKNVIRVLLWMCLLLISGSIAKERLIKRDSAQDRIHLQRSQSYVKEEPGYLSRIASWINPFSWGYSNNEVEPASAAGHRSPVYIPPPPPPTKSPKYLPPPPPRLYPVYAPPPNIPKNVAGAQESSDCNPCNREPWIPIPGKSGRNNVINFVPPNEVNNVGLNPPAPQYGPPIPIQGLDFHHNQNSINAITGFDRPPVSHQELPKEEYGPPQLSPTPSYGVPNIEITPSVLVGSLHIPQSPDISFNKYVPVNNFHNVPETPSSFAQVPLQNYGPPFKSGIEAPFPSSPVREHMVPPPLNVQQHNNFDNILGMRPPPPPIGAFTTDLAPSRQYHKNPNSIQDILQPPVSQHSVLDEEFPPYTSKPIDAYSTPDIHGIEQIPLSSGDNDDFGYPIAFPNLSIRPLVPLHRFNRFRPGYKGTEKVESIQIVQSVPIADYVSSIEHPINVIQSPIVDLSLQNQPETTKLIKVSDQNKPSEHSSNHVASKPNTIQSGIFVNPNINTGKLNENPIIVDDAQTAASSRNETYQKSDHSSKRDNNEDAKIHSFEQPTLPVNAREDIDVIPSVRDEISNEIRDYKKDASKELKFTEPPLDYSQWTPTWGGISMEMTPPSVQNSWTTAYETTEATTKKAKHIQIIIPYYNFKNSSKINEFYSKNPYPVDSFRKQTYTTLVPVYTPPPVTEQSLWSQYLNNFDGISTSSAPASPFQKSSSTRAYNIQDLLGGVSHTNTQDLPFDILTFQKNIDKWTQQAFAKTTEKLSSNNAVIQNLNPSKSIPDQYLTTVPYDYTTIQPLNNFIGDQEPAGSVRKENFQDDVGNNLLFNDVTTTEESTTVPPNTEVNTEKEVKTTVVVAKTQKSLWDETEVTLSSDAKEKVYIVTPATTVAWSAPPKVMETTTIENALLFDHPKFSIRIEENNSTSSGNGNGTTKVIFSEWPHKINNLQTTTVKNTSRHPLFGLMDNSAYNPPQNKVIANVNGHSRVLQDLASFVKEQTKNEQ